MKYTGIRARSFAVVRGREFTSTALDQSGNVIISSEAPENPDPSLFAWNDDWREWTATIPAVDCERVYRANAYAKYQGHRVNIMRVDESGTARIYYSDENGAWAEENGFQQVNKYEFEKSVPAYELYDVYEMQDDLRFNRWRETAFERPAHIPPPGQRLLKR